MQRLLGGPAPSSAWLGLPGLQSCGQGLRPSGWPLIKKGLGWEPGGQPSPWAFFWAPHNFGGVITGLEATPPGTRGGVQWGLSVACSSCLCHFLV